jgi:hypothetical protein
MIKVEARKEVSCPCGCERKVPLITGVIETEGACPFFRAYLMNDGSGANMWLMLHTGPWEGFQKDCAVIIHSVVEDEGITSNLKSQSASPWKEVSIEELHFLSRKEVLAQDGAKDWVFETYEYFSKGVEEVDSFLRERIFQKT